MAELTENLIKMGRELGYSGAELQTFVKEEKAEIRQERRNREKENEKKENEKENEKKKKENGKKED